MQGLQQSQPRDVATSLGCAALLAWYCAALCLAQAGWSTGMFSAEPLAVLLVGLPIVMCVGIFGLTATVTGLLFGRTNRRLLAISALVNAAPVLLLIYAASRT